MRYILLTLFVVFLVVLFVIPLLIPSSRETINNSNNIAEVAPYIEDVFTAPFRFVYDPVVDFLEVFHFEGDDFGSYVGDFFEDAVNYIHKHSPIGWIYDIVIEIKEWLF